MIDLGASENPELVRQLVSDLYPQAAEQAVAFVGSGWDNALYRVGPDLVARFPRRPEAIELAGNEQRILPLLEGLALQPIETPRLLASGRPTRRFGWPWSLLGWIDGQSYLHHPTPPVSYTHLTLPTTPYV